MEIQGFIQNFANQFDETDASVFKTDTKFRDLDEWSSLMALSIIAMIDEEYDVTINGQEMRSSNTVGELFDLVSKKK